MLSIITRNQDKFISRDNKFRIRETMYRYLEMFRWYEKLYLIITGDETYQEVKDVFLRLDDIIEKKNETYVEGEMKRCEHFFRDVEGKQLDEQQQRAVITDDNCSLIVAGAGSGKTLTIAAKVKYLCEVKGVDPSKILLLSYTSAAKDEMTDRINAMGINIQASTFHALGRRIIVDVEGKSPTVENNPVQIVREYLKNIKDRRLMQRIALFVHLFGDVSYFYGDSEPEEKPQDHEVYENKNLSRENLLAEVKKEYTVKKKTLKGEYVKSIEEATIANFLFLNGIEYEYEKHYPYDIKNNRRKKYAPDFYLSEYDIWWEHFGIDQKGRAKQYSTEEERKYLDGIEWKRKLHKSKRTKLIETYSWMNKGGHFGRCLTEILKENGVRLNPIDCTEIYEALKEDTQEFNKCVNLLETFLKNYKSNGYEKNYFDDLKQTKDITERDYIFLDIAEAMFAYYERKLVESGKIDFDDMINKAAEYVRKGNCNPRYRYIIVDEYQDISTARYNLLKEIVSRSHANLLCVGDDWQSIYRFTGSDVSLFKSFERFWGDSRLMRIEKTYRNSQELIEIASDFIMKNPTQIKKNLISDKSEQKPVLFVPYADNDARIEAVKKVIGDIEREKERKNRHEKITLLLLIRNNNDLTENDRKKIEKQGKERDIEIRVSTAHKSKGLEADYVIIYNLTDKKDGFPNKMLDDPVLRFVLPEAEEYEHAEERRLFYVALTRTKNRVYLLIPVEKESTPVEKESTFVSEVRESYNIEDIYQA